MKELIEDKIYTTFAQKYDELLNNLIHPQFFVNEESMYCMKYSVEDFFCDSDRGWEISDSQEDFHKMNHSLFPVQFRSDLEIYSWNDDFSNYFDDGKEWWGTALWSIYDKWMKRFIIIGASLTD